MPGRRRALLAVFLMLAVAVAVAVAVVAVHGSSDEPSITPRQVAVRLRATAAKAGDPIEQISCARTEDAAHHFFCDGVLATDQHFALKVEAQPGAPLIIHEPSTP